MTTAATYNRTVTVDLPDYASTTITFRILTSVAMAAGASEIFPGKAYTLALDANGVGSTALPCPDNTGDAAWLWRVELPDNQTPQFSLAYSGSSISLTTLLVTEASEVAADEVAALISGKQNKDNDAVNDNVAIFLNGETVDSGVDIDALGGTPDVDDLTTDTGNSGEIPRVAAAGGLEYRTTTEFRTDLSLVVGTDVQAYDALLAALAALTTSADKMFYSTGSDAVALADLTSFARTLVDDADAATARATLGIQETFVIACSDATTALTTGTAKVTFRMPFAMTLTAVRASVNTAPTGSTLIVDINESGTTILSTKLSIDASEKTSTTAAAPAVISDSALADDAEITIDIDQIGSSVAGAGLKVTMIGTR